MREPETTMGKGEEGFPSTNWSVILSLREKGDPRWRDRFSRLLMSYWRPIYRHIRAGWNAPVEDAKDLTQDFLCSLIESKALDSVHPDRGRFRHFIRAALKNFLLNARKSAEAVKRGGQVTILSGIPFEDAESPAPAPSGREESDFDAEWARALLQDCVRELRQSLAASGSEGTFSVFEAYDLTSEADGEPRYEDLARRFRMTTAEVRHALEKARAELRRILIRRVGIYSSDPSETVRELRELFGM
jgi:RNA polymerase sigma-70 factor (ECF subfamily)